MPTTTAWKDISTVTFNSVNLLTWVKTISGLEQTATMDAFHPPGVVWDADLDTGETVQSDITVTFESDVTAGGPNITCVLHTAATLLITLATNLTTSGTFVVTKVGETVAQGSVNVFPVTFHPQGTITSVYHA